MTVAYDSSVLFGVVTGGSFNNVAGNCVLFAVEFVGSSNTITSVTYGGVTLPKIAEQLSNNNTAGGVALYGRIDGVPTGANTVTVTGASGGVWSGAASYSGAVSFGTPNKSYGSTASGRNVQLSATVTGGICVLSACCGSSGTWAATSPGTLRWSLGTGGGGSGADNGMLEDQASAGGGASTTVAFTDTGVDWWGAVAVEVQPASGVSFTATPSSADGTGAAYDASPQAGAATAVLYAGTAAGISGSWSGTGNATGSGQGTYATWTDTAGGSSATLELASFGAQAAVPAGSTVQAVNCVVRHGEAPASAVASVTAQAYSGATPVGSPQPLTAADAVHDDPVTFTGLAWADLADLRVRVTVTRH